MLFFAETTYITYNCKATMKKAVNIWVVILTGLNTESTTVFPNQAWNKIASNDKKDNPVIIFLVLKNFNE